MKKLVLAGLVVVGIFAFNGTYQNNQNDFVVTQKKYNLTDKQKQNLIFMYQEEKLARDVYITLGNKWNLRVMKNIQKAEQRHMNAVKSLLMKYNISIPKINDKIGKFELPELQKMYDELISKGNKSVKDALEVGRMIEIQDIKDLDKRIKSATPDIKFIFENLKRGSEHHLKAFNINLGIS
jgi:hypothetical protein